MIIMSTDNPQQEHTSGSFPTRGHGETPPGDHETQKCGVRMPKEKEAGRHAAMHYAELDFADKRPIPAPKSDMFVVAYAEVGQAY